MARLLARVGDRLGDDEEEVARRVVAVGGVVGDGHVEQGHGGVAAPERRQVDAADLGEREGGGARREGGGGGGIAPQQPVAVENLHGAVGRGAVGEVQAVPQPHDLVQPRAARHGAARVGLYPGQAEVADAPRGRRVGEVEDLQDARGAPPVDGADEMGDAGVALPPVLVGVLLAGRGAAHLGRRPHEGGPRRLGDVPDLVALVAVRPEQVEPPGSAPRELFTRAHLDHLGAAGPARRGDVGEVDRRLGVGDVDDGGAVGLDRAGQGIQPLPGVVADVDDAARALADRQRLVGGARLQVVRPDEAGVEGLLTVTRGCGLGGRGDSAGGQDTRGDRHREQAMHGRPPGPGCGLRPGPVSGYPKPQTEGGIVSGLPEIGHWRSPLRGRGEPPFRREEPNRPRDRVFVVVAAPLAA